MSGPPTWRPGDRWTYAWTSGAERGTKTAEVIEIKDVKGVSYYVVRLGDSDHYYTRDLHWAAVISESKVVARMQPPQPWFMWPLEPKRRWTSESVFEQPNGTARFNDTFMVVGTEAVDVPAGRFQTVKIVRQTNKRDLDEYWYAPEVRWYVRWHGRRGDAEFDESLQSYTAGQRLLP
ncbi:MAG TPA: hypothetical protein VGL09_20275 [Methylomirabilota bacterium]|jgi:hypothetical protein